MDHIPRGVRKFSTGDESRVTRSNSLFMRENFECLFNESEEQQQETTGPYSVKFDKRVLSKVNKTLLSKLKAMLKLFDSRTVDGCISLHPAEKKLVISFSDTRNRSQDKAKTAEFNIGEDFPILKRSFTKRKKNSQLDFDGLLTGDEGNKAKKLSLCFQNDDEMRDFVENVRPFVVIKTPEAFPRRPSAMKSISNLSRASGFTSRGSGVDSRASGVDTRESGAETENTPLETFSTGSSFDDDEWV